MGDYDTGQGWSCSQGWSRHELEQSRPELAAVLAAHEKACGNFYAWTHSPFYLRGDKVVCTKCEQVVAVMSKKKEG